MKALVEERLRGTWLVSTLLEILHTYMEAPRGMLHVLVGFNPS